MKAHYLVITISSLLLTGCKEPVDQYKDFLKPGNANVILITGQSNASGNSPYEFLENKSPETFSKFKSGVNNVLTSYWVQNHRNNNYFEPTTFGMADGDSLFGPEIGIADVFSKERETTYIIKYAVGGTTLHNQWLNEKEGRGKLYKDSIDWFKKKLEYLKSNGINPKIIGQFWMQGEGDSIDPICDKYASNLKALINYYRDDLRDYYDDHYSFIDAYISTKTLWSKPKVINEEKQKVADADPYVYCIKTNGEDETAINLDVKSHSNEGDDMAHYDSISEILLGQTVGQIIKETE